MKSTLICVPRRDGRRFVCQKNKQGSCLWVTTEKFISERQIGGEGEVRGEHTRKRCVRGARLKGERENGLHSQKPLKFDSPTPHSLNKSTCRSPSPFLSSVWDPPFHPHPAFGALPPSPWQDCEFWQGFANIQDSCASCQTLHIVQQRVWLCVWRCGTQRERQIANAHHFMRCVWNHYADKRRKKLTCGEKWFRYRLCLPPHQGSMLALYKFLQDDFPLCSSQYALPSTFVCLPPSLFLRPWLDVP